MEQILQEADVQKVASSLIRKYDWCTEQYGYGVHLVVTDGAKKAGVVVTADEDIETEIGRLIQAVDEHRYGELDG